MLKDHWTNRAGVLGLPRKLLDFILPSTCLHCDGTLTAQDHTYCANCAEFLELAECPLSVRVPLVDLAAAFDHFGPATSLVSALRHRPALAQGAAGYLAVQLLRRHWPIPDFIIPVPLTRLDALLRGFNPAIFLARSLAKLLSSMVMPALRNHNPRLPQRSMSDAERRNLPLDTYVLKSRARIQNKTILLVDDTIRTGATLRACAHAVGDGLPAAIYGLTLTGPHG